MRGKMVYAVLGVFMVTSTASAKKWPTKRPSAVELGKQIYDEKCMGCHGAIAAGDGPAAAGLVGDVPDFSKGFGKADREVLIRSVMRGKKLMPGFDTSLSREDVEATIQHMSQVWKPKPEPKPEDAKGAEGKKGEGNAKKGEPGAKGAPAAKAPEAAKKPATPEDEEANREAAPPPE